MTKSKKAMPFDFEPIDLNRQSEYIHYFRQCPQKTSDYSFVNLWGWADAHGLRWAWTNELVWIKQTSPRVLYWAPVGPWEDIDWDVNFNRLLERFGRSTITRIPVRLIRYWEKFIKIKFAVKDARGAWDYLQVVSELIELKGNRFRMFLENEGKTYQIVNREQDLDDPVDKKY